MSLPRPLFENQDGILQLLKELEKSHEYHANQANTVALHMASLSKALVQQDPVALQTLVIDIHKHLESHGKPKQLKSDAIQQKLLLLQAKIEEHEETHCCMKRLNRVKKAMYSPASRAISSPPLPVTLPKNELSPDKISPNEAHLLMDSTIESQKELKDVLTSFLDKFTDYV